MRELFDEVAGQSPFDPEEPVRRATRMPRRKRFYTSAGVGEADGGLTVTLDGKPIRTPSGRHVVAPNRAIAEAIAAEWNAQSRDHQSPDHAADALCQQCRRRRRRPGRSWSPTMSRNISAPICCSTAPAIPKRWSPRKPRIGIRSCSGRRRRSRRAFHPGRGDRPCPPAGASDRRRPARCFPTDPWSIAALHVVTTLTGSALLALALVPWRAQCRRGLGRRPCR